jgi:hypothetical protein
MAQVDSGAETGAPTRPHYKHGSSCRWILFAALITALGGVVGYAFGIEMYLRRPRAPDPYGVSGWAVLLVGLVVWGPIGAIVCMALAFVSTRLIKDVINRGNKHEMIGMGLVVGAILGSLLYAASGYVSPYIQKSRYNAIISDYLKQRHAPYPSTESISIENVSDTMHKGQPAVKVSALVAYGVTYFTIQDGKVVDEYLPGDNAQCPACGKHLRIVDNPFQPDQVEVPCPRCNAPVKRQIQASP